MPRAPRFVPPFEARIDCLGAGGSGVGTAPDGSPFQLKPAPPGSVLEIMPLGKRQEIYQGRRLRMVTKPDGYQEPDCAAFGICGGCVLQELELPVQRRYKAEFALKEIAEKLGVSVQSLQETVKIHPVRGADAAYHYRNKVEISFGPLRFLDRSDFEAGLTFEGRFLGFHAPGRFDRVADVSACSLISDGANAVLQTVRREALDGTDLPLWNQKAHTGFWRHLLLRQGHHTGEILCGLYTASDKTGEHEPTLDRIAQALLKTPLPEGQTLVGVIWLENDSMSDVTRGTVRRVWGRDFLTERLGEGPDTIEYRLSLHAFFQTSTRGAEILYDTLREAVGRKHSRIFDLYCGIGSIGLYLRDMADHIVGVEEWAEAVHDARANASLNGVHHAEYHVGRMEETLQVLAGDMEDAAVIVDPPRNGLHPKVTEAIGKLRPATLLYVACKASSLGRDAKLLQAMGWRMSELWTVDLFPQTGHIEAVARFVQEAAQ